MSRLSLRTREFRTITIRMNVQSPGIRRANQSPRTEVKESQVSLHWAHGRHLPTEIQLSERGPQRCTLIFPVKRLQW